MRRDFGETSKESIVSPSSVDRSLKPTSSIGHSVLCAVAELAGGASSNKISNSSGSAHANGRQHAQVEKFDTRDSSCNRYRPMAGAETLLKGIDESFEAGHEEVPQREECAPVSESCASPVEAWINEEFGEGDDEVSHTMRYKANLRQEVEGYIEVEDLRHSAADSGRLYGLGDADSEDSEESEMGFEPQLWSFA